MEYTRNIEYVLELDCKQKKPEFKIYGELQNLTLFKKKIEFKHKNHKKKKYLAFWEKL